MKTPKRTMTKDHVEIERYIRGVNCQFNAMKSRWKRKNREARLRHKIALLTKELEHQKQIAKQQHQIDRERYEESHQKWYELKLKYQELKKQKKGS